MKADTALRTAPSPAASATMRLRPRELGARQAGGAVIINVAASASTANAPLPPSPRDCRHRHLPATTTPRAGNAMRHCRHCCRRRRRRAGGARAAPPAKCCSSLTAPAGEVSTCSAGDARRKGSRGGGAGGGGGGVGAGGCVAPHVDHGSSPAESLTCVSDKSRVLRAFWVPKTKPKHAPKTRSTKMDYGIYHTLAHAPIYRPYFLCARAPINSTSAGLAPCE